MSAVGLIPREFTAATALFLLANPLTYRVLGGDDKGAFFFMPLVCIYAFHFGALPAAVAIGVFAGWTGMGAAAIPLLLGLPGTTLRRRLTLAAVAAGIMALMLAVDGAEGLVALTNRAARELEPPFWFSIWRWFPAEAWPAARAPVIAAFIFAVTALLRVRRISFNLAFVLAVSVYLLFSNNTVPTRIMFFAPLLMICFQSEAGRLRYMTFAFVAIIAAYALIKAPDAWRELLMGSAGVAICNAVMAIPIAVVLLRVLRAQPAEATRSDGPR